jgi:regulator of nucleoside diphosphate kinase
MPNGRGSILKDVACESPEQRPPILLTTTDRERLLALLGAATEGDSIACHFLREEIERAEIASSDISSTSLVTMGCEVKFIDHDSERIRRVRLVYPDEASNEHCISVLSTIGSALIGLGPGQSIRWGEHGRQRGLTVLEIRASDRVAAMQQQHVSLGAATHSCELTD